MRTKCPAKRSLRWDRSEDTRCCYGGVALVVPDGDGQDGAKTAHHKALEAMDFRFKQDSAL